MNLHMAAEVASVVEVLPAHSASGSELPSAAVDRHVVFEVAELRKGFAAFAAGVTRGRRVALHMRVEAFVACEYLRCF